MDQIRGQNQFARLEVGIFIPFSKRPDLKPTRGWTINHGSNHLT